MPKLFLPLYEIEDHREVKINYFKRHWTLDEVIELIKSLGFKVRLSEDSHVSSGIDLRNLNERRKS